MKERERKQSGLGFLWLLVVVILLAVLVSLSGCGTAKGICGDMEYMFHGAGTLAGDMEDAYK